MNPQDFTLKEAPAYSNFLQYKGVWDMQDLYEFVASFFHRQKFKFYESRLIQKRPGPFGPETYYVWNAERKAEEYYKMMINIFLHTYDTQDIEVVMKNGSKRTFTKGRLWIHFRGGVEMDYENVWQENTLYANLRTSYHKYVICM